MNSIFIILCCLVGIAISQNTTDENPIVDAPTGKVQGSILTSRLGRKIYSFRGVRYGQSPIGNLRFKPPIPSEDWKDVFDASEEGPSCPHPDGKIMSEDCLRLNVYTTNLPKASENVRRPVMVFLHPGGFYGFSAQSINFGPQYLLDKDIVLVTVNYRLGSLGFLNTGDGEVPGNMGLKDQVVALRWVQRNIAAFGGNPDSVTLCGYSAGSFSIMLHLVSPMSKNLFHKAITMSSSAVGSDVYGGISQNGQMELVKKQARLLNCSTDSTASMVQCMRTKPSESFVDTLSKLFDWYGNPILLWKPAVEPDVPGLQRFLTEQPYDLIKQGKFQQVPMIMGVTRDEFGGIAAYYEKDIQNGNGSLYRELNERWETLAPIIFMYERDSPRSKNISKELKRYYFGDQPISSANNHQLAKLYGDSIITFPMYRVAKLFSARNTKPVYFYKFTYQGRFSFSMWNDTTPNGVTHHDDLQYLFFIKQFFSYFDKDAPEIPMVELSTSMWANFVQTGEPIPKDNQKLRNINWSRFTLPEMGYLDINLNPCVKYDLNTEDMQEWDKLFPVPESSKNVKH